MSNKQEHSAPLSAGLLQKYRKGKLSATEMHRVERLLLEDPFYAEAIEGLDKMKKNASLDAHMIDLKERLAHRISSSQKTTPLYRPAWQIAAAVLLLAIGSWMGYYYFTKGQDTPAETMISMQNEPEAAAQQKPTPLEDEEEARPKSQEAEATAPVENPSAIQGNRPASKPGSRAEDAELADALDPVAARPETLPSLAAQQPAMEAGINTDEQIKVAKVPEKSTENTYRSTRLLKSADAGAEVLGESRSFYTLKGTVISGENKMGVPGANVMVKNTATGIITDVNGEFKLAVPEYQDEVVFSSIGFLTVERKLTEADSNLTIVLEPDIQALSEVVVVNYGTQDKKAATNITQAQPSVGFSSYKNYLKENLQYPAAARANNIEGTVKVAFEVLPGGVLQNFSVEKSLGHGCDEEALRLIKEGPAWQAATEDGKPIARDVTVKVKFSL